MRVLVVEDDAAQRTLVDLVLLRAGFECVTAPNAEAALVLLTSDSKFDAVLTDIRMPGMDGVDFLKEVKRRLPHMPVIVMTVHETSERVAEAAREGALACVPKPFLAGQLVDAIKTSLRANPNARVN